MTTRNTIEIVCFVIPTQEESHKVVNVPSFVVPQEDTSVSELAEQSHKVANVPSFVVQTQEDTSVSELAEQSHKVLNVIATLI